MTNEELDELQVLAEAAYKDAAWNRRADSPQHVMPDKGN